MTTLQGKVEGFLWRIPLLTLKETSLTASNSSKQFHASITINIRCESQRITTTQSWWFTYSVQSCHGIHWSLICFADVVFRDNQFDSVPSFWLVKPLVSINCYLGSQRFSENQNIAHHSIVWAEKMLLTTYSTQIQYHKANLQFLPVCITAQWCDSNFVQRWIQISKW